MSTDFLAHLHRARATGSAIPAFTCYDLATAHGVLTAATRRTTPVILLVSPTTAGTPYGITLIRGLRALVDAAAVPAVVQLDHASAPEVITTAVRAGVQAILADASRESLSDNIAFVQKIRQTLKAPDLIIEAELGRVDGDEDVAAIVDGPSSRLTRPEEAAEFVHATGVDLLAVSVGNVHGRYAGTPRLDLDRLAEIGAVTSVPLVLHGASGLPGASIAEAVRAGVAKINVNTELRQAVFHHLSTRIGPLHEGLNLDQLLGGWVEATAEAAGRIIDTFTPYDHAHRELV